MELFSQAICWWQLHYLLILESVCVCVCYVYLYSVSAPYPR